MTVCKYRSNRPGPRLCNVTARLWKLKIRNKPQWYNTETFSPSQWSKYLVSHDGRNIGSVIKVEIFDPQQWSKYPVRHNCRNIRSVKMIKIFGPSKWSEYSVRHKFRNIRQWLKYSVRHNGRNCHSHTMIKIFRAFMDYICQTFRTDNATCNRTYGTNHKRHRLVHRSNDFLLSISKQRTLFILMENYRSLFLIPFNQNNDPTWRVLKKLLKFQAQMQDGSMYFLLALSNTQPCSFEEVRDFIPSLFCQSSMTLELLPPDTHM